MLRMLWIAIFLLIAPASSHARCVVTDPTGTPLNIRATPNGKIIGTLRNGASVTIRDTAYDSRGRPWVYIGSGWVFREFVTCY